MFERFTEKARRVIFFARYEASEYGGEYIDTTHLLLGLLREDRKLFSQIPGTAPLKDAAELLGLKPTANKVSVSIDIPLSEDAKRALAHGAEESELLGHPNIETGHLLLGLLRQPGVTRTVLETHGYEASVVRAALAGMTPPASNLAIVSQLRAEFAMQMARLTPEVEPAVIYRAGVEKAQ